MENVIKLKDWRCQKSEEIVDDYLLKMFSDPEKYVGHVTEEYRKAHERYRRLWGFGGKSESK
jgi:hypothetical protein